MKPLFRSKLSDNFIGACVKLELVDSSTDFFLTTDLYDGKNIPAVIDFLQMFCEKTFATGCTKTKLQPMEVVEFEAKFIQEAKKLENIGRWAIKHQLLVPKKKAEVKHFLHF